MSEFTFFCMILLICITISRCVSNFESKEISKLEAEIERLKLLNSVQYQALEKLSGKEGAK